VFPKVSKPYNYIYAGVALDALVSEVQPLSRAAARSSLHPSPKFFIYSLRSGELPVIVRRAFPVSSSRSSEFRHHQKVPLDLLYVVMPPFSRIRVRLIVFLIYLSFPASSTMDASFFMVSGQPLYSALGPRVLRSPVRVASDADAAPGPSPAASRALHSRRRHWPVWARHAGPLPAAVTPRAGPARHRAWPHAAAGRLG
jgi:hypothetical protein